MYRLLIVTDEPAAKDMFAAMEGWEAMGFKAPRVLSSTAEALDYMSSHRLDAVAAQRTPAFEELFTKLDECYPNLPLVEIARTEEEQRAAVRELYSLLTRLRADDTNDEYDDASQFARQRDRWMRKVISGMIPTEEQLRRQLRLYRCMENPDVPCVLARLELPDDDNFLSERWHYGSERLETALRNFFGCEHDHMQMRIAVISQEEVRILCYPVSAENGVSENAAFEYVQETVEQIAHYIGLHMHIIDVRRIAGLKALTAENDAL